MVWFQVCQPLRAASIGETAAPRLARIALNWQDGIGEGFYIEDRETAGITLRVFGGAKSWNATTEYYTSANCCVGAHYQDAAVDFTGDNLDADIPASMASPLTLQFVIPAAAGMLNPLSRGRYSWEIVTVHEHGSYCSTFAERFSSPILEVASGSIELWPGSGGPGSSVEISGTGFKPFSPVQSIRFGALDLTPYYEATTDDRGNLDLEIIAPGLDVGSQLVVVQVGQTTSYAFFVVTHGGGPTWDIRPVESGLEDLGDNLAVVFHFYPAACHWSFYDPEFPEEGDLTYVITGETYWILVKEPQEVILNRETRNLTCTSHGNCWNRIVW